jgi:predicted ATP-grasp superfamily ATP-dependent carboligase
MPKSVLLTLGRLPKALALARALDSAGYRVVIAEPFRWHVCKPSRSVAVSYRVPPPNSDPSAYLDALLHIVERESIDLIVPVSEEALHVAQLHSRLPRGVRLLCPSPTLLGELHDKLAFARRAESLSLTVPDTFAAGTEGAAALARQSAHVVKPAKGCSGIGLELRAAGTALSAAGDSHLVQRLVEGRQVSTLSFLEGGRCATTVCYEGTVFAGTVAICFQRVDELPAVAAWVEAFCRDLEYTGFIAFDFIVAHDGTPWAIECNPRVTSGAHFFEQASLGRALTDPASGYDIKIRQDRHRFQWGYSTLTEAYASFFRPREFFRCLREMVSARDVVWSWRDPLPFLLMTPMSWEILWPAMTAGISLGEATQRDIAKLSGARHGETASGSLPDAVSATGGESGR